MFVCHACQIDVCFSAASRKKDIILASMINKYSTYFVTALARFFSSKPRRPKSLLCGRKFHLQRAQEALSVEHLVASTDIFYGSFPEVAPDARRHTMSQNCPKCKETPSHSEYNRFWFILVLCPIHVLTFTLISILVREEKRPGSPLLFWI